MTETASTETSTHDLLRRVIEQMPPSIGPGQMAQIDRFAFEVDLVRRRQNGGARVCDIGGGWGTFALGCAAAGMRAVMNDDFRDLGHGHAGDLEIMRGLWKQYGVEVRSEDLANGLPFPDRSFDVITTFDCIEHWHDSPRKMLRDAVRTLVPGGLFIIATPNAANLRKRISMVVGKAKWSAMADWYDQEVFRGHVREPDVDDLRYIARDIGLERTSVIGRNFAGYHPKRPAWIRAVTPFVDHALRTRPSLCSNIYLLGYKPKK